MGADSELRKTFLLGGVAEALLTCTLGLRDPVRVLVRSLRMAKLDLCPFCHMRRGRVGNELGVVFDLAISAESWITSAFIMADVEELRSTCAEASS